MATKLIGLFLFNNPGHRLVVEWRFDTSLSAPTWRGKAKQYAKQHGQARALLADGTLLAWYRDDSTTPAKLRQRHYTRVSIGN